MKQKKSSKQTTQKSTKRKQSSFSTKHPLVLPVFLFFMVVFLGLGMFVSVGATTQGARDKRVVDLFIDGEQQTLSTRADTVEDLLDRLELDLLDEDIVEPARQTPIFEDNTQINVYRARPVSIIDGDRTIIVLTAQRAPRLVVEDAGINLFAEDEVRFERSEGNLLDDTAGERLIINRSVPIQLNVYGAITQKRTTAKTVGEVLEKYSVTVEDGATLQPADRSAPIVENMLIAVNKIGVKTESVTEEVPYETESRNNPELEIGQTNVVQVGEPGERSVIYEITESDGVEVERKELQSIIITEPVTEIIERGTKLVSLDSSISVSAEKQTLMAAAGIAESDFAYVDYIITKESNWRPGAINSSSGAYGLCQALPGSKMATAGSDYLTNPVTQLRWCAGYAAGRYGGWQGAYNAWLVQSWW
jgi:uncharacterized protein YabE (DUF348 family)